jgi:hypothetical protein
LGELGGRSSGWIGEPTGGPEITTVSGEPNVVRAVEVDWVNDDLGAAVEGEPQQVVQAVIDRSSGPERYLQASRSEIAASLPGLTFPDLVPPEVTAITSQLVIGSGRDRLDDEVYAAFGLWTVEPYSRSRSVGQRGTFTVASLQQSSPCDRFAAGAAAACTTETIGAYETVRIDAESGQTWVWFDETYEYQLFLRGSIENNKPVSEFMIRNEVPYVQVAAPGSQALVEPSDSAG